MKPAPARCQAPRAPGSRRRRRRPQLVKAERQGPGRPVGHHDGQGDDGLAGPAAEVVDVERRPGRQEHDLRRHHRRSSQSHRPTTASQMRVKTRLPFDPARCHVPRSAAARMAGVGGRRRPGAEPRRPRWWWTDPGGPPKKVLHVPSSRWLARIHWADAAARSRVEDAEEVAQQKILGVHGDVGLQLPLPPPVRMLELAQLVAGGRQRTRPPDGRRRRVAGQPARRCVTESRSTT